MKPWCSFGLVGSLTIALLGACGSEVPPPQHPTPAFESRVGQAAPRVEPPPAPTSIEVPPTQDPLANDPARGELSTPPTTASGPSEREMCYALLVDAKLHVEDMQGGVALVITPKAGGDLDAIKQAARTIESKMPPAGMTAPPAGTSTAGTIPPSGKAPESSPSGATGTTTDAAPADACILFDLGRKGARASVAEEQKAVRILLTTSDPASVKLLRARTRELVRSMSAPVNKGATPTGKGTPQTTP